MTARGSRAPGPWALCVITSDTPPHDHLTIVRAAVAGGAPLVQLRAKGLGDRALYDLAAEACALTRAAGICFIVNDRVDIALAVGADGVHLGPDDLPWDAARRLAPGLCIGASVSTLDETSQAEAARVNYLGVGPVFGTPTKADAGDPLGLEGLRAICNRTRLPVLAIGGITAATAPRARAAGADGVAVVSAVATAPDPTAAVRDLLAAVAPHPSEERR